ncbi:MAG: hypothetical protein KJ858_04395, partial [Nanoarchaeota archaeon]|nr:hypothetical protein [Nanoarchaeota archaeon]
MVEAGNYEAAKEALEKYKESAEELEKEIDPEKIKEAQKSSYTIKKTLKELEGDIPEEYKNDFVTNTLEREEGIRTAVEISSKIKELCVQLAELDPMEYSKMCKFDDDAPKWQKKLDKDLSAEQEKVAKEFVNVMKNCFKSSGQDCACEDIPFYDFSIACSKAAPLATACDIDGDEIACDELDNLDMPELPEWLEPIWKDLEMGMNEAQYDMHMPPECVKAGVTNPKECGRIMIKEHAPLECRAALLAADVSSESEGREICDKIMFEKHSPQECIDKGLTSPKECAELMDNFRGSGPMDKGMGFGIDCSSIEDKMERLDCYDNKGNEMGEHYGVGEKFQDGKGELTWQCKENRIHWAPDCKKFMEEEWPEQEKMRMQKGDMRREQEGDWRVKEKECVQKCGDRPWDFSGGNCQCGEAGQYYNQERGFYGESECKDGCSQECGNQNTDCVNEKCVCLGGGDEEKYTEWVRAAVERYDGDGTDDMPGLTTPVKYWQIDNEPPRMRDGYVDLVHITYKAIKEADPEAKVLVGGLLMPDLKSGNTKTYEIVTLPIIKELGGKSIDIFDYHWFGYKGEWKFLPETMKRVRSDLKEAGFPDAAIWFTEMGTYSGNPDRGGKGFQSERDQASEMVKRYVVSIGEGVEKIFWAWGMKEGFEDINDNDFFDNTGFI